MSIKVMNLVWSNAPATVKQNTFITLLALADWSDDEGKSYPSIGKLCKKARQSERSVQYCLRLLKKNGIVAVEQHPQFPSNLYTINLQFLQGAILAPGAKDGKKGVQNATETTTEIAPNTSSIPKEHTEAIVWLSTQYRKIFGFTEKTWTLTDSRRDKAATRLAECLKKAGTLNGAVGMMLLVMKTARASSFHMGANDRGTKFISWEQNLFRSQEQMEEWLVKAVPGGKPETSNVSPINEIRKQRGGATSA